MPEFKPTGPVIKLQNIEPEEGIKTRPETLEVNNKVEAQENTVSPQESHDKKVSSITKRLDNLNNIEKTRKELGLSDLKNEETEIIARQKLKLQEELTGMKQQTTETESTQTTLENNTTPDLGEVKEGTLYSVEDDPRFRQLLEKEAYFRLKTYDKEYFDEHYSGLSDSGYLVDLDGKETNSLPTQNISGKTGDLKYSEFVDITKQKFFRSHPDAQEAENKRLASEQSSLEQEKMKIYDNPNDDPFFKNISEDVDAIMKYKNSPRSSVFYSHIEKFIKENPEKTQKYLQYGEQHYKDPNEYQPSWYEQLKHVSKFVKPEGVEEEKEIILEKQNTESAVEVPVKQTLNKISEEPESKPEAEEQPKNIETDRYTEENKNIDEVGKDILLDPDKNPTKKIEIKEVVPFDVKKVYSAVENMLIVFDVRARKLGGFDIMTQKSFDNFAELYQFMTEKIIDKDNGKIDFDVENEVNTEMLEKFSNALDSIKIMPGEGWQSLGSQQEYYEDLNKMRDSMGYMLQEVAPFAKELEASKAYSGIGARVSNSLKKLDDLRGFFEEKANSYESHMR